MPRPAPRGEHADLLDAAGLEEEYIEDPDELPHAATSGIAVRTGNKEKSQKYPDIREQRRRKKQAELLEAAGLDPGNDVYDAADSDEPRAITTDETMPQGRQERVSDYPERPKKREKMVKMPADSEDTQIRQEQRRQQRDNAGHAAKKGAPKEPPSGKIKSRVDKSLEDIEAEATSQDMTAQLREALEPLFSRGGAMAEFEKIEKIVRSIALQYSTIPGRAKAERAFYQFEAEAKKLLGQRDDLGKLCKAADADYAKRTKAESGGLRPKKARDSPNKLRKPKPFDPLFPDEPEEEEGEDGKRPFTEPTEDGRRKRDKLGPIIAKLQEMVATEGQFHIWRAYHERQLGTIDKYQTWATKHRILSYALNRTVNMFAFGLIPKPVL